MAEAKTETVVKEKKVSATSKPAEAVKAATKKAPAAKAEKVAVPKAKAATPAKKPAAAKAKKSVTPEQRYCMICEAAYFKAERRGFSPENEIQDWLDAEAEINKLLSK
jgi:hypothetical protein